ncbi:hypothetical protein P879_03455 [Paragonimus westermani]|uniref:Uncharacterized protein n=1 Tax=Paragonimus westermani TaxID=34504 RepID=A0A8T0DRV8_9TREM|nr:hypothetical protein P879_03455 [Paragonimus westermani]
MSSTLTNSDSRHSTLEPGKTDYECDRASRACKLNESNGIGSLETPVESKYVESVKDQQNENPMNQTKNNRGALLGDVQHYLYECLRIAAEQASPQNNGYRAQPNAGVWSAVLVNKPDDNSQNPHLKITVEIPLLDLLSSVPTERMAYPNEVNENIGHGGLLHKRSLYEMDRAVSDYQNPEPTYVRRTVKHNTLPHQYRSTIFKAVGQVASEPEHGKAMSLDSSTSKSYLVSLS